MKHFIKEYISDSIETKQRIMNNDALVEKIKNAGEIIAGAIKKGNKILIAGNGGSAADSQHIAAEFICRFYFDRDALPAIALTVDTSVLTASGNDYGFINIFSRQIEALGKDGDIFIAITTSGNSPNIIKALEAAKKKNMTSILLTGQKNSHSSERANLCIKVPSEETPKIQESHIMIGHILCAIAEKEIFSKP